MIQFEFRTVAFNIHFHPALASVQQVKVPAGM